MQSRRMADRQFGIAIIGLGRAGSIHLETIRKSLRCRLLYIIEEDIDKAIETAAKYSLVDVRVIAPANSKIAFSDKSLQAVVVCSPTFTHQEIVKNALRSGKAVFCEKPLAEDVEDVLALYKQAHKAELPLVCSFNRRFDPSLRRLKNEVRVGGFGKVHVVKTCARDHPLPPMSYLKISGGFYHDCAVHDIDLVCWILNEFPVSVYAQSSVHNEEIAEIGDVDTTIISLKFPSGALASIDLSRNASYGYDQRCEVFGAEGMIVSENHRPTGLVRFDEHGTHSDCIKHSFPQRYHDSYIKAIDHFLNVVEGKDESDITALEVYNVCKIATACEESAKLGKQIDLDLLQEEPEDYLD